MCYDTSNYNSVFYCTIIQSSIFHPFAFYIKMSVQGQFGNNWDISLISFEMKHKFMKFHDISIMSIENRYVKFQLHNLVTQWLQNCRSSVLKSWYGTPPPPHSQLFKTGKLQLHTLCHALHVECANVNGPGAMNWIFDVIIPSRNFYLFCHYYSIIIPYFYGRIFCS